MRTGRRSILAALAVAIVTVPPTPAASQSRPRTIVALLAHADDETAAGPALARYAREGADIQMIIVTDGAGGSGSQTYLQRPDSNPVGDALVKARADEARCAAKSLGAHDPILLGFPDGKLGDYLGDRTLMTRLTDRIAKEIERLHPDVVITWGPDGGTGHPDHRIVGNIATQLLRYGAPGMPERLYYMYIPAEMMRLANPQRGEPPLLFPQAKYFTVKVSFTPADLDAASNAMACHKTQFSPELMQRFLPVRERVWHDAIAFVPASAALSGNDLFAMSTDPPHDSINPARSVILHIPVAGGVRINALAYVAQGSGSHPAVLLLHGLPGNEKNLDLAQAIRRAGWDVITFNYRGSWGSPGKFRFANVPEDADSVIAFLQDTANARSLNLDPHRIVMGGHSMGGWATVLTASHHPELAGAFIFSATDMGVKHTMSREALVAFMADNMEALAGVTAQSMADEIFANGSHWQFDDSRATGLSHIPMLVLTSDDGRAPQADGLVKLIRSHGSNNVVTLHQATDHSWSDSRLALESDVITWLQQLK